MKPFLQTKAVNGTTSHGFPWTTEYVFTFNFAGDKIAGTVEFVDATLVLEALGNEAIAAKAELNCKN
jgi:ketosteroid isomerase-like protein